MMNPDSVESMPHYEVRIKDPAFDGSVVPFTDGSDWINVAAIFCSFY